KFPRNHRFVLGERIERNLYDLLEILIRAKFTRNRQELLQQANLGLEVLRFQMRLAKDLQCLKAESYGFAAKRPPRRGDSGLRCRPAARRGAGRTRTRAAPRTRRTLGPATPPWSDTDGSASPPRAAATTPARSGCTPARTPASNGAPPAAPTAPGTPSPAGPPPACASWRCRRRRG